MKKLVVVFLCPAFLTVSKICAEQMNKAKEFKSYSVGKVTQRLISRRIKK